MGWVIVEEDGATLRWDCATAGTLDINKFARNSSAFFLIKLIALILPFEFIKFQKVERECRFNWDACEIVV
jgi:hypothetical protein